MSLRRPKMQIKPKVSTRSMTSKAANADNNPKPSWTESSTAVPEDSSAKDGPKTESPKTGSTGSTGFTSLTTKFYPVFDDEIETTETSETIDDSVNEKNENICEIDVILDNREDLQNSGQNDTINEIIIGHKSVVNEETNALIEKEVEIDSNSKDLEIKPKLVSKAFKETNRKRRMSRKTEKSDKAVMKMKDLLVYNPPMTDEQKEMRDKDAELTDQPVLTSDGTDAKTEKPEDNDNSTEVNSDASAGPRVKVGADGLLILDEESVIVKRRKSQTRAEAAVVETAGTTSACTNYSSFRSKAKSSAKPRWTEHETIRFYSALNTIGTDFTLMSNLFFRGKRSRLDLRNKFKKEEKTNNLMIDEALFSPNNFINQCPELEDLLNDSSSDDDNDNHNDDLNQESQSKSQTKT